ncbi:MAG: YraN family protein [Candidatus Peregrinibacteria bacterium]
MAEKRFFKSRKEFGDHGEQIAIAFLRQKGYRILDTNFRKRVGEVDIVAMDGKNQYVFVEVKTRRNTRFGYPEESVNFRKLRKILMTGQLWLAEKKINTDNYRLDVISIEMDNGDAHITHFENLS